MNEQTKATLSKLQLYRLNVIRETSFFVQRFVTQSNTHAHAHIHSFSFVCIKFGCKIASCGYIWCFYWRCWCCINCDWHFMAFHRIIFVHSDFYEWNAFWTAIIKRNLFARVDLRSHLLAIEKESECVSECVRDSHMRFGVHFECRNLLLASTNANEYI